MSGYDFVVEHMDIIERIARKSCRGRYDLVDELMEDAFDRTPRIVELWNPVYGVSLEAYVFGTLRRYMWKWMNKNFARLEKNELLEDEHAQPQSLDFETRDEVNSILERLDEYDRTLLVLYFFRGNTFKEIAAILNVSKGTARNHFRIALKRAKEVV